MKRVALITGVSGQDGSYLAEFLLEGGYDVVGVVRQTTATFPANIAHLQGRIALAHCDLIDSVSLADVLRRYQPDELYNLGSQSYPGVSWTIPIQTAEITGLGAHRVFDAVRQVRPTCRVYQASSSEMFGRVLEIPQRETTPFAPINPYGAAKLYAHNIARIYRESFGMFIACGILFNHESPRRGFQYVSQKVCYGAACLKLGIQTSPHLNEEGEPVVKDGKIAMGNLDAKRDWGYARDYVEAMWLMLQQDQADDFVIGTAETRSVADLCAESFSYVGLDWQRFVKVDARLVRPTETGPMVADYTKAERLLGWRPRTSFSQLVSMMVDAHLARLT